MLATVYLMLYFFQPDLNVVAALMLERLRSLCEAGSDTEDSQLPANQLEEH